MEGFLEDLSLSKDEEEELGLDVNNDIQQANNLNFAWLADFS